MRHQRRRVRASVRVISGLVLAGLQSACFQPVCETTDPLCVTTGPGQTGADHSSRALAFDGVDDAIQTAQRSEPVDQAHFTFETWFKTRASGTLLAELLDSTTRKALSVKGGQVCGEQLGFGGDSVCTPGAGYADDQWHHAALVFSGSSGALRLVVDGTLAAETTVLHSGGMIFQTTILAGRLPDQPDAGTNPFLGELDEIRVWTTERSVDELAANRSKPLSTTTPGLRVYLPLEGTGSTATATDVSATGNDAALTNFTFSPSPWRQPGAF